MTENTSKTGETDTGSKSAVIALDTADAQADLSEELTEIDEFPEDEIDDLSEDDQTDIDDNESGKASVLGSGAVSGGFGIAGLALAVVSLTTNWTSSIVVSRGQLSQEVNAPSSGLSAQQELNMYASGWHTQGWWALVFAAAAVLIGAGALVLPGIRRGGGAPGWARAVATGAIIVGLIGVILAVLTIVGVFGGHLTAPTSAG